jgi:tRNA U34 5-methylaminomethyl-2-thiouridine-forming methyltransferase MnmC
MLEIIQTADGSNTIYNSLVGENYHSRHGALQESQHVFVNSGLIYFLGKNPVDTISILEVGFGTGLNFLLSADECTGRKIHLEYTGIEAYPLSAEIIKQTGYDQYASAELWRQFVNNYEELLKTSVTLNPKCGMKPL